jgi:hypothetical protein
MTTVSIESFQDTQEYTNSNTERVKMLAVQAGRFIFERLTFQGDYQMGRSTSTPVFAEEHKFIRSNIVLGEE